MRQPIQYSRPTSHMSLGHHTRRADIRGLRTYFWLSTEALAERHYGQVGCEPAEPHYECHRFRWYKIRTRP